MDALLIFFVLPLATIILACVLERILKCPVLVAATFFAIYLILTYTVFGESFLIVAIIYAIVAFLAALLCEWIQNFINRCGRGYLRNQHANNIESRSNGNNCSCNCNCENNETQTVDFTANITPRNSRCGSFCGCYRRR